MTEPEEWSTSSNDAVKIALVQPGPKEVTIIHEFHPNFTYSIFGDEEVIFGYQGLNIDLRLASHDLRPNLDIAFDRKFKDVGETKALDIKETLETWLPPTAFESPEQFNNAIQNDPSAKNFRPPGQMINTYTIKDRTFEIWRGKMTDLAVQQILKRMQIFVPFFIDGGTYVNLNEPDWSLARWRIFFLYEKLAQPPTLTASSYSLVGYCTTYRNFVIASFLESAPSKKDADPFSMSSDPEKLPCRERISQFIILPPYQGHGHGTKLYNSMYASFLADPTVIEVTVEDPNASFDDLRDYCDLTRLRQIPEFTSIRMNTTVSIPKKGSLPTAQILPPGPLEALRVSQKLIPRQFSRLLEMQLLSLIPSDSRNSFYSMSSLNALRAKHNPQTADKEYRYWKLLAKQRLYIHNRDQLAQLDRLDRIDKLNETLGGVEADYVRLLLQMKAGPSTVEKQEQEELGSEDGVTDEKDGDENGVQNGSATLAVRHSKRRIIVEDDDEDEEDTGPPYKKAKS